MYFFEINYYYVFLKKLNQVIELPNIGLDNIEFFNIKNNNDLYDLIDKNYIFNNSEFITDRYLDKKNSNIFTYFFKKELMHFNCYWIGKPYKMPILKEYTNYKSIFIGPAFTAKKYRGLGLYQYDFINGFNYFYNKGYTNLYGEGSIKKKEVKFFMKKSGFEVINEKRILSIYNKLHLSI